MNKKPTRTNVMSAIALENSKIRGKKEVRTSANLRKLLHLSSWYTSKLLYFSNIL